MRLMLALCLVASTLAAPLLAEPRAAIPRQGNTCPSGYHRSGEYCVQNR